MLAPVSASAMRSIMRLLFLDHCHNRQSAMTMSEIVRPIPDAEDTVLRMEAERVAERQPEDQ